MRIIDLSRELYHRTPSYPGQPPIIHGVWKTHEEAFADSGNIQGNSVMFFSTPDQRVSAGELHRAGQLHRSPPHRAEGRDHAVGPRSRGEEGRRPRSKKGP